MSLANEKSQVPPGFRFHPTEEELLHYYLKKKVTYQKIDLDVICDVDLNKLEPWDTQEKCKIGSTPQNEWYFFNHKDKKYPTGIRVNRATAAGFWKATGRDKVIYSSFKRIGMRKTLVFHKGRAPQGLKSNWIMHEYRLDNNSIENNAVNPMGETTQDNGWVVCRIFKKKNDQKSVDSPNHSSITTNTKTQMLKSQNDGPLDQILDLQYMGSTCKQESEASKNINITTTTNNNNNMGLLREFDVTIRNDVEEITNTEASMTNHGRNGNLSQVYHNSETSPNDWIILDQLVACCNDPNLAYYPSLDHDLQFQQLQLDHCSQEYNNEIVLWTFT